MLTVDMHRTMGYRIAAPRHGTHVLSPDGTQLRSAFPRVRDWQWQRLLFAQVLPLSATVQGLELFHASAVAFDTVAIGLVAPSGTGKTSVAAHLVAGGARFVTDDVMALEATPDRVRVHPGPGVVAIFPAELDAMSGEGRARLGTVRGRAGKMFVAAPVVERPLPLHAIYFLERVPMSEKLVVSELTPPDPKLLLSSAFIWYLDGADHLLRHLDACASIAQAVKMFKVLVPPSATARDVAASLSAHVQRSS